MGLIRDISNDFPKAKVHDLSRLFDNQNILKNNLYALIGSAASRLQNFEEIPMDNETIDFPNLLKIYCDQYMLVDRAINLGVSSMQESENYRRFIQTINDRLPPTRMKSLIQRTLKTMKPGDIIDLCGYRGTGYYFVYLNEENNEMYFKKTSGSYGCHLPEEAWQFIEQFSHDYYHQADIWACHLPKENSEGRLMFSWLNQSNFVEINGNQFRGEIKPFSY